MIHSGRRGGSEEHLAFRLLERATVGGRIDYLLLKHVQEVGQQVQKGVPTLRISESIPSSFVSDWEWFRGESKTTIPWNGLCLPWETHGRIFEPFQRLLRTAALADLLRGVDDALTSTRCVFEEALSCFGGSKPKKKLLIGLLGF